MAGTIPVAASNVTRGRGVVATATHARSASAGDLESPPGGGTTSPRCRRFRPGFGFWQHVFSLPDHSIAYGSAVDGRLLVTFPTKGNWTRDAEWIDRALARTLDGELLPRKLSERRDRVALLLERERRAGPAQLHPRRRPQAKHQPLRALSRRVGRDLREVRRACRHRARAGHPRIGAEPDQAFGSQRRRVLPVAPEELEAARRLLACSHRWQQPDDTGALLRCLSVRPRYQIRIVHSRTVRAQRRRNECRAHVDHRRTTRRRRCPIQIFPGIEAGQGPARPAGQGIRGRPWQLRPSLVSLRGDGVRQHVHRQSTADIDAAGSDLRHAHAARDHPRRGGYAVGSVGGRGPTLQSRGHSTGPGRGHALPAGLRQRVRPRRLLLAASCQTPHMRPSWTTSYASRRARNAGTIRALRRSWQNSGAASARPGPRKGW